MSAYPTDVPLNCPYCGQRVVYRGNLAEHGIHVYRCTSDGLLGLRADGTFDRARPEERRAGEAAGL